MKNVDVVFILDKSGSMHDLVDDAIGGYNSLIEKTKELDANIRVTTVLFNDRVYKLYDRVPINEVAVMTKNDYQASGCTALLDAVGTSIDFIDDVTDEDTKVLFYITTDGMENSSQEYSYRMIQKMIKQHEKLGYEFNFLASGINATEVGVMMGIRESNCKRVSTGRAGQKVMYAEMCYGIKASVNK